MIFAYVEWLFFTLILFYQFRIFVNYFQVIYITMYTTRYLVKNEGFVPVSIVFDTCRGIALLSDYHHLLADQEMHITEHMPSLPVFIGVHITSAKVLCVMSCFLHFPFICVSIFIQFATCKRNSSLFNVFMLCLLILTYKIIPFWDLVISEDDNTLLPSYAGLVESMLFIYFWFFESIILVIFGSLLCACMRACVRIIFPYTVFSPNSAHPVCLRWRHIRK